jgi:hypothetical protein
MLENILYLEVRGKVIELRPGDLPLKITGIFGSKRHYNLSVKKYSILYKPQGLEIKKEKEKFK